MKYLIIFLFLFLIGCRGEIEEENLKKFVEDRTKDCNGIVESITMVREGLLSNKFVGFATVKIKGEEYFPELVAYTDGQTTWWQMMKNPCYLSKFD